jgi:hypothetical protein
MFDTDLLLLLLLLLLLPLLLLLGADTLGTNVVDNPLDCLDFDVNEEDEDDPAGDEEGEEDDAAEGDPEGAEAPMEGSPRGEIFRPLLISQWREFSE